MKKSYLSMLEYPNITHHKFFTSKSGKDHEETKRQASEWASQMLREHGTHNVRVTLSEVITCITG